MEHVITETSRNKRMITDLYEKCLNQRQWEMLPEIFDEEYEGPLPGKGPAAFENGVKSIFHSFPDLMFTIRDLFAENQKVVVRWEWKGTNVNPFRGFPASGKKVLNNGIAIFEFKQGKVIRSWLQNERLELLKQIGAVEF